MPSEANRSYPAASASNACGRSKTLTAVNAVVDQTLPSLPNPSRAAGYMPRLWVYASRRSLMEPSANNILPKYEGSGYSASVELRLRVNGCVFPLAQVAGDRVIFDEPTALPEGDAEVLVTVDGKEQRTAVRIEDRGVARRVVPIVIESSGC